MQAVAPVPQSSAIDIGNVVKFLTHRFRQAISTFPRDNQRGSQLHKAQVDFSYLIDEIQRGPSYQVGKIIADTNTFISTLKYEETKA